MSAPRIAVVGGGLAGLRAALACADAGARVQLLEARPRLGGATWSRERDGLWVDNGQHVFMRCCTHYLGWLERLGVRDRVHLQPRLAVPVLSPGRPPACIRRAALPAPAHLAPSLLRFAPLPLADRLRAARSARAFARLDPDDPELDEVALGAWLRARGESDAAIDGLWDLLIRPTLNLPAREASLALAARVLRTGFLERADGADVGWSEVPLQVLHGAPAAAALRAAGARVELRTRVERLEPAAGGGVRLLTGAGELAADAAVVALPPGAAARVLAGVAPQVVSPRSAEALGRSPIVGLHTVWDRAVLAQPFAAGIETPVQWIFDRTRSAGLERGQYLTVSLSAATEWQGRPVRELRARFEPALRALLPAARGATLERFFVTCEPEATFLQRPGSRRHRPAPGRVAAGVHLAGAWTDTGWPATMESAVQSGLAAAESALAEVRGRSRTSAAAA